MHRQETYGRSLRLTPDTLLAASGGYDAIAAELEGHGIPIVEPTFDSGDSSLDVAIQDFADSWATGLDVLVQSQRDRCRALHEVATLGLGVDVDSAYAAEVLNKGFDLR